MLDLAIIGSGPAALTATIYAARAELSVTVFERAKIGGTLPDIAHIGNFPGFDGPGADLAKSLRHQAESCGVKITYGEVEKLDFKKQQSAAVYSETTPVKLLVDGEAVTARAALLATGSEPIPLSFTPASPVSYCALCDAPLYKDKRILVIGGGNSAVGESLMLAEVAESVTIMTHSQLKAEQSRIDQLKKFPNITIVEHTEPSPENTKGYDGIFVYIGKRPATTLLDQSQLDAAGYAQTAPNSHQIILTPNLFAAGDVRANTVKQAIVAAADGAEAAIEIIKFLQNPSESRQ